MGAEYICYTEIKRNNEWHAINGLYYNEKENQYKMVPTYINGSRTYFSNTFEKMKELGHTVHPSEISIETLNNEEWLKNSDHDIVVVPYNKIESLVERTHRHEQCGYVHKSLIWQYETEDAEIDYFLNGEEFSQLTEPEKQEFEYYEWDDATGWFAYFKKIASIVDVQLSFYADVNEMWSIPDDVRILCICSY